jgi:tetratricopeptide (TPR) repeat protein
VPVRTPDAEELHARAVAAASAGRHDEALRLLVRARTATEDPELLARIDLTSAYAEAETGDATAAMARCRSVLEHAGTSPDVRGLAHSQLGLLWMRRSEHAHALTELSQAIGQLHDPTSLAVAHLNRGNVHLQRADAAAARTDFARAAEHYRAGHDPVGAAKAGFNQAYCALLTGDLVAALQGMDDAGAVLAPLSAAHRATIEQDKAEVLRAAGRVAEAVVSLQAAAAAYGAQRLRRYQAEAEFALASTFLAEDPERARRVARTAARRFSRTENPVWAARAEALAVVAEMRAGSRSRAVLRRADELADVLRAAGHSRDREQLALESARSLVRRGGLEDAAEQLRRTRLGRDAPVTLRLLSRQARAELHRARSQFGRARQQVRAGLQELHAWQSSFGSLDLRSTLVGHGNELARLGLEMALRDGDPRLVLEWAERARALASRVTPVRPPPDPQLAHDLTELRMLPSGDHVRRRALREQIRQQSWYGAGGGLVEDPVGFDVLQGRLAATDAVLVAHIVLAGQLHALIVTADSAHVRALGEAAPVRHLLDRVAADLDTAAVHRTTGLGEMVRASLAADVADLDALLLQPLAAHLASGRVVLTPSALLAGAPWTLLPTLAGRPVAVPPSATRWQALLDQPLPAHPDVGLVVGPDVPRAREEVERAAAAWTGSRILAGADATAARVGELAAQVDVLHLAGHGRHVGDNPLFSEVLLYDGPWSGYDIETLDRTPAVVVLSACELGRTAVRSAEETVGMTAAWLHAGARTVVSAPATVADDTACQVLADWHQRVAAGAAPADALAAATAAAADVAPFICFGAGW